MHLPRFKEMTISVKLKCSLIVPAHCQPWSLNPLACSHTCILGRCQDSGSTLVPAVLGTQGTCRAISVDANSAQVKYRYCCFPSFNCLQANQVKLKGPGFAHQQQPVEHIDINDINNIILQIYKQVLNKYLFIFKTALNSLTMTADIQKTSLRRMITNAEITRSYAVTAYVLT